MQFPKIDDNKGGKFIKMKSGDRLTGLFVGDPVTFSQHWIAGKSSSCAGAGCEHCKAGDKASARFQFNFMTQEEGVWVAKVFEHGMKTLRKLESFHKDYDLENTLVTVSKQGEKMTTEYNILPVKVNLKDDELKKVKAIPLNKLGKAAAVAPTVLGATDSKAPY